MLRSPARVLAFGFGSGLLRPAPGTWGTLFGWASYVLLLQSQPEWLRLGAVGLAFALGVWACGRTGRDLGVADHGGMVWDEVAAFWLVLALVPDNLGTQLAAFGLFRLFDIVKPPPIRYFDATIKNGFGVMFDDTLAAGYTLLVMALWQRMMT
jgi:phosphatidylglycerophosphatase A